MFELREKNEIRKKQEQRAEMRKSGKRQVEERKESNKNVAETTDISVFEVMCGCYRLNFVYFFFCVQIGGWRLCCRVPYRKINFFVVLVILSGTGRCVVVHAQRCATAQRKRGEE